MYKKVRSGHTQPTAKETEQMVKQTARFIDEFRPLSRLQLMINKKVEELGVPEMAVKKQSGRNLCIHNWLASGRIPYHYVDVLMQIDEVKKAGYTAEMLRPDVKEWHLK